MNENFGKNSNEILNESSIENANTNTADVSDTESKIREIDAVIAKYSAMLEESKAKEKATESIISTSFRKKMLVMATVMCFAVVTFISSSFASFTATSSSHGNVITSGGAGFDVVDLIFPSGSTEGVVPPGEGSTATFAAYPGETIQRSVSAVNRGGVSVYVRAKIDCTITLKDKYAHRSDEIDTSLLSYTVTDSWLTRDTFDGYYYYSSTLPKGAKSPEFLQAISFSDDMANIYKGATVEVSVVFEIVQAEGNGETVFDAEGWPVAEEGGNA